MGLSWAMFGIGACLAPLFVMLLRRVPSVSNALWIAFAVKAFGVVLVLVATDPHMSMRQYARLLREWVSSIGLELSSDGTHSMRPTKVAQVYQKTGSLRWCSCFWAISEAIDL